MVDTLHANNLSEDRNIGQYWESKFCELAAKYKKAFVSNQIDKTSAAIAWENGDPKVLPDILILSGGGEHHEIKHKNPVRIKRVDSFGLEVYRFNSLVWLAETTGQKVMYTIHNHDLSGGKKAKENNINHWFTANVLDLKQTYHTTSQTDSYVNGRAKRVNIFYWSMDLFNPLIDFWTYSDKLKNSRIIPISDIKIGDIWRFEGISGKVTIGIVSDFTSSLAKIGWIRWVDLCPAVGTVELFRLDQINEMVTEAS